VTGSGVCKLRETTRIAARIADCWVGADTATAMLEIDRSNSTADLQRHHSKLSLLIELLLRLLRRACGLDCLHYWVQRSHADNASNQWAWIHAILVYIASYSRILTQLYTMIIYRILQCCLRQFCSDNMFQICACDIMRNFGDIYRWLLIYLCLTFCLKCPTLNCCSRLVLTF